MRIAAPPAELADLIDLEVVLARRATGAEPDAPLAQAGAGALADAGLNPAAARAAFPCDRALRRSLLRALLARLRRSGATLPGARLAAAYRLAGRLLALAGLLLGWGAARAALASPGGQPINVWRFLGGLVLLQVLLFVVLLAALAWGATRGAPWSSLPQELLRALARRAPARARAALEEWRLARERLGARQVLLRPLERWLLFGLSQRFGLFFNLGAAATFVALVLFTDLAFAWSTTPAEIEGRHLAVLVDALALPWSWLAPHSVPSMDAITATRWSHLAQGFTAPDAAAAAAHAAGWWSFLLSALLCWGLLPRLAAWSIAGWKLRRALAAVPLDDVATMDLLDAMLPPAGPVPAWAHPEPEEVAGALLAPAHESAAIAPGAATEICHAVLWGGWSAAPAALDAALQRRRGWRLAPDALLEAGGAGEETTRATLARLAAAPPAPLALLAEAGEPPDKRVARFLAEARRLLGAPAPIAVELLEAAPDGTLGAARAPDVALWRDYLALLHDPYLRVEALAP